MSETIDYDRRRILGATLMTIAAAQIGRAGAADAHAAGTKSSFGPLKQINAGLLNVGYAEAGPAEGPPVILLHGWPYDIYSYVDVAPLLAAAGYRVIVPYLRGYGTTQFRSSATLRNGQPSALAVDMITFMDALKIERATLAGFDWGRVRPTLWRCSGRSAAKPWCP
jgi:pimeloyl-ACP methyl ester carboxylesterase